MLCYYCKSRLLGTKKKLSNFYIDSERMRGGNAEIKRYVSSLQGQKILCKSLLRLDL